jgi:hypothetical protein
LSSPLRGRWQPVRSLPTPFRTDKHLFATRPIFHKLDETIRGRVFCSFLALMLKIELEQCPGKTVRAAR